MTDKCKYCSTKIERAGVHEVERKFIPLACLDTHFSTDDKGILIDGEIAVFSSPDFSVETIEYSVPVQIKGTTQSVGYKKAPETGHFRLKDIYLEKFSSVHGGVLFFVVELHKQDLSLKGVYYTELLPLEIAAYLLTRNKDRKTNIQLKLFPEDEKKIVKFIEDFHIERGKQASSNVELSEIKDGMAVDFTSTFDERYLLNGEPSIDVSAYQNGLYLYTTNKSGSKVVFNKIQNIIGVERSSSVLLDTTTLHIPVTVSIGEDDNGHYLSFEPDLHIRFELDTSRVVYQNTGTIRSRYNTASFLIDLFNNHTFILNKTQIDLKLNKDNQKEMAVLEDIQKTARLIIDDLEALNIIDDYDLSLMSSEELHILSLMTHSARTGKAVGGFTVAAPITFFEIGGYKYYARFDKVDNHRYQIRNLFHTAYAVDISSEDKEPTTTDILSFFLLDNEEHYAAMKNISAKAFSEGLATFPINDLNYAYSSNQLIKMLKAYDRGTSPVMGELLECCQYLAEAFRLYEPENDITLLNVIQVRKRQQHLTNEDKIELEKCCATSSDLLIRASAYALLDMSSARDECRKQFTEEQEHELLNSSFLLYF